MLRPITAFLVAPLVVPILVTACFYRGTFADYGYVVAVVRSPVLAYFGVFVVGLPTYLLLRARKWTAFWLAPSLGFILTIAAWCAFTVLSALESGYCPPPGELRLTAGLPDVLWRIGPIGAIVGALLWLIVRPDRTHR